MPVTRFLTAAYNAHMEATILLVLLMMGSDDSMKQSLRELLAFYRENRELLRALVQGGEANSAPKQDAPQASGEQKSRPEEVGDRTVIEEYLRKLSV